MDYGLLLLPKLGCWLWSEDVKFNVDINDILSVQGVGTFPQCASGDLVCQDGQDLKCLVAGKLTEEKPNFG